MPDTLPAATSREAAAEAERLVAWLRLPAIALLALSEGLPHPNPHDNAFIVVLIVFSAWSAGVLAWVHLRPAGERLALATTAIDIFAITCLVALSGGAFSHARLAFLTSKMSRNSSGPAMVPVGSPERNRSLSIAACCRFSMRPASSVDEMSPSVLPSSSAGRSNGVPCSYLFV